MQAISKFAEWKSQHMVIMQEAATRYFTATGKPITAEGMNIAIGALSERGAGAADFVLTPIRQIKMNDLAGMLKQFHLVKDFADMKQIKKYLMMYDLKQVKQERMGSKNAFFMPHSYPEDSDGSTIIEIPGFALIPYKGEGFEIQMTNSGEDVIESTEAEIPDLVDEYTLRVDVPINYFYIKPERQVLLNMQALITNQTAFQQVLGQIAYDLLETANTHFFGNGSVNGQIGRLYSVFKVRKEVERTFNSQVMTKVRKKPKMGTKAWNDLMNEMRLPPIGARMAFHAEIFPIKEDVKIPSLLGTNATELVNSNFSNQTSVGS